MYLAYLSPPVSIAEISLALTITDALHAACLSALATGFTACNVALAHNVILHHVQARWASCKTSLPSVASSCWR